MNEACTQANTGHLDVAPQVAQLEKRSGLEGAATVSGLAAQGVALSCDDLAHQLGIDASLPELAAGLPRLPQNYVDELRDLEELDQCLKEGVALHACTYSLVRVWRFTDAQYTCVHTLRGHSHNVSCVMWHPRDPE
ncbi:MAG: hypothetical protein MHM6MM_007337, partial [Cercozoa sp. M6MM]